MSASRVLNSYLRTDRVLSLRERERFRREIADRERALEGHIVIPRLGNGKAEGMSERRQGRWESHLDRSVREDSGMLRAQIQMMKRQLEQSSPRDLSRKEKRILEKQAEEDREYLKRNMVPSKLYNQPSVILRGESRTPNPVFEKAQKAVYEKEVANREFQARANRYKNIMRELAPDDPAASNIEQFRQKK